MTIKIDPRQSASSDHSKESRQSHFLNYYFKSYLANPFSFSHLYHQVTFIQSVLINIAQHDFQVVLEFVSLSFGLHQISSLIHLLALNLIKDVISFSLPLLCNLFTQTNL